MTLPRPPKTPAESCYDFLSFINSRGKALKWDLIKMAGNKTAFRRWFDGLLKLEEMVAEIKEGRFTYYKKRK